MSVKRHLLLNGAATVLQKAVIAGRQLLVVPFFIHSWGLQQYGEWITLSAIPVAMAFCNFGLGTAAGNSFVLAYGKGDLPGAARAMRSGVLLVSMAVLVGILLGGIALAIAATSGLLAKIELPATTAIAVICLLALATLVNFFTSLNEAWYRAARRNHQATHFTSLATMISTGLIILILLAGGGMVWIAGLNVAVALTSVIWLHHRGTKLLPDVDLRNAQIDRAEMRIFIKKGLAFLMSPARQAIHSQGMIFVTRIALGPEAVVLIATLRTLGNTLAQASLGINATIFPELQHAIATGRDEDARRIYRFGTGLSILVGLIGCAAIGLFGPHVYHAWTTGKLQPPDYAWIFLILGAFVPTVWCAAGCTFRAVNKPEASGVVGILTACIGVALAAVLVGPLGINGVLIGLLVMETSMGAFVIPATCKIIGQSLPRLPRDIFALRNQIFTQLRGMLRRRPKPPLKPSGPAAEETPTAAPAHSEIR